MALFLHSAKYFDRAEVIYGNKAERQAAIVVQEGLILQYVHGPGLSNTSDHGSNRSSEGCTSNSRVAGRSARRAPAESSRVYHSEEPHGQEISETLHTLQTLMLKLIRREELVFKRQSVGFNLLKEAVIAARSGREIVFAELARLKPQTDKLYPVS